MRQKNFFRIIIGILAIMALTSVLGSSALAAVKHKTLHRFNGSDGSSPGGTLVFDAAGNLYGVTAVGGTCCGTAYELSPNADRTWTHTVLHYFTSNEDIQPSGGLTIDASGNLYGMTVQGPDAGDVYELVPQLGGGWSEEVLHKFGGPYDGNPQGGVTFDAAGNLYGTGAWGCGTPGSSCVFKMTPTAGGWTFNQLYQFPFAGPAGWYPSGTTPIFDAEGNIYATTAFGGNSGCSPYGNGCYGLGVAFELLPNPDGTWSEKLLHTFTGSKDGESPACALVFDAAGNLYGTTFAGGAYGYGNVFMLTPNADGTWTEKVLHQFTGGKDGGTPVGGVIFDAAGNLYGTASKGGAFGYGVVFKLIHEPTGRWEYGLPYSFDNKPGAYPSAGLVLDSAGNLYGTTTGDGRKTLGSVFEITP